MKISDIEIENLTPMMRQYVDIKLEHPDKIIFFRLGEFYEMFFEDAILASNELEIALTGKNAGLSERIPMCGVPAHSYINYLEKLVEFGHKVAIVEQLEEAGNSKLVKRGIVQVVTPGTIIKEDVNVSYIASYTEFGNEKILTFANISTGELLSKVITTSIESELDKYDIKEIVCEKDIVIHKKFVVSVSEIKGSYENLYGKSETKYHQGINLLLSYIDQLYHETLVHFKSVEIIYDEISMKLDLNAIETLELTKSSRTGAKSGSLFWFLDQTSTAMGSRMLKKWIINPLINPEEIIYRQNIVSILLNNFIHLNDLQVALKSVYDLERICAKISVGSANARDLIWLKNSLSAIPTINAILKEINVPLKIEEFTDTVRILENAINVDAPISLKDGKLIKYGYNSVLDELKDVADNGKNWLIELEQREREKTGIKNLKVKYNKVFGYFIEVSNGNLPLIKEEYGYDRKQTLTNGERFSTAELKEKEDMILNVADRLVAMEYELFVDIRNSIKTDIKTIQKSADIISIVDVLCSFACVADVEKLVKPNFNSKYEIEIKNCRHVVVEKSNNTLFVANDIEFNSEQNLMLITGPNMSGKSTYMRQMALTAIMAQIGSFVACSSANLMLFDAIFTRIGARDDLSSGQSTFMVEMLEANYAISNATKNSLILFDELGRGTSTYDGMSISNSIIDYSSKYVQAKTMFSTHYHELTSLANEQIFNVHASVIEENEKVIFKHKIEAGPANKSYGIYVASLAGLPKPIIETAHKVLKHYETEGNSHSPSIEYVNLESKVESKLQSIDINSLSPIDALNLLNELKKLI